MREDTPPLPGNSRRIRQGVGLVFVAAGLLSLWLIGRKNEIPKPAAAPDSAPAAAGAARAAPIGRPPPAPADQPQPVSAGRRLIQKTIPYGGGEGEIGMLAPPGQTPVGPESYSISRSGKILIADRVNHRVAFYDLNGNHLRNLDMTGITINDLTVDQHERLYVYEQVSRTLRQFDAAGQPVATLRLDPADLETRGYFHVIGEGVYFADAAARDILVASLDAQGRLIPADPAAERRADGIHGESGRIFSVRAGKFEAMQIQIHTRESPAQRVNLSMPDLLSARFAGEDDQGRFYVQVERWENDAVALEVLAFSPAGEVLGATPLPENDYALWTTKLVEVTAGGALVQFLPREDQARINVFAE